MYLGDHSAVKDGSFRRLCPGESNPRAMPATISTAIGRRLTVTIRTQDTQVYETIVFAVSIRMIKVENKPGIEPPINSATLALRR
jgi:hypothetical protein